MFNLISVYLPPPPNVRKHPPQSNSSNSYTSAGLCFILVCVMTDPAWVATITKAKVPEAAQTKLVDMGYCSRTSFSFAREEVFKAFTKHALQ